jgi:hypothetical protein
MDELRDAVYYIQLARAARLKADSTDDADLALRLREAAVRNERKARQMRRRETAPELRKIQDAATARPADILDDDPDQSN